MAGEEASIVFTGDIAFTHYFKDISPEQAVFSEDVGHFLASGDYCVANIEGPVLDSGKVSGARFSHFTDQAQVHRISPMNIWNLANNHSMDYGEEGLDSTLQLAERCNSATLGAGRNRADAAKPVVIPVGGGVGIVALSYEKKYAAEDHRYGCFFWDDPDVPAVIEQIHKTCRWCVVVVHGGDEFAAMPMPDIRERYLSYLEMGADVVVGHHPHVVQNFETVGNKIVFYSLGNFIFDTDYQRAQANTDVGILLRLRFSDTEMAWDCMPVQIDRERETVVPTAEPIIFQNIPADRYQRLLPFAQRGFLNIEHKRLTNIKPQKYEKYGRFLWFMKDFYGCRVKRKRMIFCGSLKSYLRSRPKAEKKLLHYLLNV